MAAIHDLLAQIEDQRLRDRIQQEWDAVTRRKTFGLVFEQHLPELVPLYKAVPRKGDLVCRRSGSLEDTWRVRRVSGGKATCIKPKHSGEKESTAAPTITPLADLLVVRQFGEPIFPALTPIDAVQNGPADAPWHTLIEADNYHALQLLEYLYAGQVDCIYIDPPYNTGARDWKYNNDYVDGNDSWRHSKWLSFMEKRLRLAKRLLKPDNGVLIVTIDKNELHHLGILLADLLPDATRQVVTICINPSGTSGEGLSRVEEYAIFCFLGVAEPSAVYDDGLSSRISSERKISSIGWESLLRRGNAWFRKERPNLCYPIILSKDEKEIVRVGAPLTFHGNEARDLLEEKNRPLFLKGHPLAWPVRTDGRLGIWRVDGKRLNTLNQRNLAYVTRKDKKRGTWSIKYLMEGSVREIASGAIEVVGKGKFGETLLRRIDQKRTVAKTMWNRRRHIAGGAGGTNLLVDILGKRDLFPFPKSVYAVFDTIYSAVGDRPHALIVDFFAGSGTTLNAVNLLNASDGGHRQCIMVTNNEVAAEEASVLRNNGFGPSDHEWEAHGICRLVTWPRSKYSILGRRDDGMPIPGAYFTGKSAGREKARNFCQIGFVTADALTTPSEHEMTKKRQLVSLIDRLPRSLVTENCRFIVSGEHNASILFDTSAAEDWLEALEAQEHITDFYIVTPKTKIFNEVKAQVDELLGPQIVQEEEKRLTADGFAANLSYFKLDFLDKERVELREAFREILPLLWLKAGAMGVRPEPPADATEPSYFAPKGTNFAVLLDETCIRTCLEGLKDRTDLSHLYIVTDAEESFRALANEAADALLGSNVNLQIVQLYRDYLMNFTINRPKDKRSDSTDRSVR